MAALAEVKPQTKIREVECAAKRKNTHRDRYEIPCKLCDKT